MSERDLLDWVRQVYNLFEDSDKKEALIGFFREQAKHDRILKEKIGQAIQELRNLKLSKKADIKDFMILSSMEELLREIIEEK